MTNDNDNLYIGGIYNTADTQSYYNKDGSVGLELAGSGDNDGALIKYGFNGRVKWGARLVGSGNQIVEFTRLVNDDKLFVSGYWKSNTGLLYDANNNLIQDFSTRTTEGTFFVKLSNSGLWYENFIMTVESNDTIKSNINMRVKNNDFYTVGFFSGAFDVDFRDADNVVNHTLSGSATVTSFIAKGNHVTGKFNWVVKLDSTATNFYTRLIQATADGGIVQMGYSNRDLDIYDITGYVTTLLKDTATIMTYMLKYNSDGTFGWITKIENTVNYGYGNLISNDDAIYISVCTNTSVRLVNFYDAGLPPTFSKTISNLSNNVIAKYDWDGQLIWTAETGGTNFNSVNILLNNGIFESDGSFYIGGVVGKANEICQIKNSDDTLAIEISALTTQRICLVHYSSDGFVKDVLALNEVVNDSTICDITVIGNCAFIMLAQMIDSTYSPLVISYYDSSHPDGIVYASFDTSLFEYKATGLCHIPWPPNKHFQ